MQAISPSPTATTNITELAADLFAVVLYMNKDCNSDLLKALGVVDLSMSQIKLLHQLVHAEHDLTLKQAAELVHVSLPAASRLVDDLVHRGFVFRHEDAADRRMKRVRLTDEGAAVTRRLNAARLNGLEKFAATLNEPERDLLAAALSKLLEREEVAACRPEGLTA